MHVKGQEDAYKEVFLTLTLTLTLTVVVLKKLSSTLTSSLKKVLPVSFDRLRINSAWIALQPIASQTKM